MSLPRFGALISFALAALLPAACEEAGKAPQSSPRPIAWAMAELHTGAEIRPLAGVVRASRKAPLSFRVGGRIEAIHVKLGEGFEKGALLARLDETSLRLALEERQGSLAEARARLTEAKGEHARKQRLHARGWVSEAGYEAALRALETARARLHMARARLTSARDDLAEARLEAPYAGVVVRRLAEPSQRVAPGQAVLEIQGHEGLEVHVSVPETMIERLQVDSRHEVRFPAREDVRAEARVKEIAADSGRGNAYPVVLSLADPPPKLRPGLSAEVLLRLEAGVEDEALVAVPLAAFLADGPGRGLVFVHDAASGTVSQRAVEIARLTRSHALIRQGLAPGEIVAAAGVAFLEDGQPVRLLGHGPARYNR